MALDVGTPEELGSSMYLQMDRCQPSALRNEETETTAILPLDEVLKVLLDEDAKLVLDLWDVLRICRSSVWDLVILETLIGALIVTCRPETF